MRTLALDLSNHHKSHAAAQHSAAQAFSFNKSTGMLAHYIIQTVVYYSNIPPSVHIMCHLTEEGYTYIPTPLSWFRHPPQAF